MVIKKTKEQDAYTRRFEKHRKELEWLYTELYGEDSPFFQELCREMRTSYEMREEELKKQDQEREGHPDWYKDRHMTGMMLYTEQFAGTLQGVLEHLDYIRDCHVNYLHLMPLFASPKRKSDGGYAVADFRKIRSDLGTMEDLETLARACHQQGISLCLDFVMNHTSDEHEWAEHAKKLEKDYMDCYFFYDSYDIPEQFEQSMPQVFPTTAPGNFTWFPEFQNYVMTTFHSYQWDLNYRNPRVFNAMAGHLLYLANRGVDVFRLDAVPYIWKTLGTSCRNLPQVHTILRLFHMICEVVCPGVVLLGEVVMEPDRVSPYFGSSARPECQMLYNVTTMCTLWNTVATKDTRLLRRQLEQMSGLAEHALFLNYLRCHDDIRWGLDYGYLEELGMQQMPHKQFLNDYFTGEVSGSWAEGERYNEDPDRGDARICGTTASLCGLERSLYKHDSRRLKQALDLDIMLHAFLFTQSGIPILYSGDELGQINDYSYKEDPEKAEDARYVHRPAFSWAAAEKRKESGSVCEILFKRLKSLEEWRGMYEVFDYDAKISLMETGEQSILGIMREKNGQKLIALFNFSEEERTAWIDGGLAPYMDLELQVRIVPRGIKLKGYSFQWLFSEC